MGASYRIARLTQAEACVMPVRPGTEGDCRPGPLGMPDDRTELCATDAFWMLGDLAVCDQHLRCALEAAGDTYQAMLARYRKRFPADAEGVPAPDELLPWSQRPRRADAQHRTAVGMSAGRRWRRCPRWAVAAPAMRRRTGR